MNANFSTVFFMFRWCTEYLECRVWQKDHHCIPIAEVAEHMKIKTFLEKNSPYKSAIKFAGCTKPTLNCIWSLFRLERTQKYFLQFFNTYTWLSETLCHYNI